MARKAMKAMPPRPAFYELQQPIIFGNGKTSEDYRKRNKTSAVKVVSTDGEVPPVTAEEEEQAFIDEEEEAEAEAMGEGEGEGVAADDLDAEEDSESHDSSSVTAGYRVAEEWMQDWHGSFPQERKGKHIPNTIRAYALCHAQGLELEQVAESMRQPPLALTTVASYVLEVVRLENLPYEPKRLQQALETIPAVARKRYWSLSQKVEADGQKTV